MKNLPLQLYIVKWNISLLICILVRNKKNIKKIFMKSNQHPNKNKIIVTLSTDCLITIKQLSQISKIFQHYSPNHKTL